MNRREAVQYISLLVGGTVIGSNYFLAGCTNPGANPMAFTPDDVNYLDEIAETILPATKTPGAKAAQVGKFMTVMVNDCYDADDQKTFHEGMDKLDKRCKDQYSKSFMDATPQQRHDLLVALDKDVSDYQRQTYDHFKNLTPEQESEMAQKEHKDGTNDIDAMLKKDPNYYFKMMKELTLLGYFTSEIGCTQARRYIETPGRYDGCVDYHKGDKAWA
jgi:glucoside 3-dehydrogenase (cytochrome c) hitch-hiker subunit